ATGTMALVDVPVPASGVRTEAATVLYRVVAPGQSNGPMYWAHGVGGTVAEPVVTTASTPAAQLLSGSGTYPTAVTSPYGRYQAMMATVGGVTKVWRSGDGTNWQIVTLPTTFGLVSLSVTDAGVVFLQANASSYPNGSAIYRWDLDNRWYGPVLVGDYWGSRIQVVDDSTLVLL